jgi:signal transduction histidine kinase
MSVQKWLLPTLSEVLAQKEATERVYSQNWADETLQSPKMDVWQSDGEKHSHREVTGNVSMAREHVKAEQQWCGAIAALEHLLQQVMHSSQFPGGSDNRSPIEGLVLTGPLPVLSDPELNSRFQSWIFTPQLQSALAEMFFQLPPAKDECKPPTQDYARSLPLLPVDPLASEQFCLVLTSRFSLVMVLGENLANQPAFLFSFDPEVVQQAWGVLRMRMLLMHIHQVRQVDALVEQFAPTAPDYRTVMQFSRLLLKYLPEPEERRNRGIGEHFVETQSLLSKVEEFKIKEDTPNPKSSSVGDSLPSGIAARSAIQNPKSDDVELLQAFAHEVRTPLTTIRMLTRLLLKRKDLAPDIIKRLEYIDRECTEQIDRMELLFRAAELETSETKSSAVHLTTTSLAQLFEESVPRWQKQASRRNLTLDVLMPQQMPPVESDPAMLDQILTGLIENFTRNLPAGSHIQLQVMPAGNQLKVQLQYFTEEMESESGEKAGVGMERSPSPKFSKRKMIGQLLMFQPDTGSICLNHSVTKNLFQALGGKLIVKERPQQGEVLTIFLPIVKGKR